MASRLFTRSRCFAAASLLAAAAASAQQDDAARLAAAIDSAGAGLVAHLPADNLCFSPASAALAMLLTHAGARGATEAELAKALAPADWPSQRIHAAAHQLQERLRRDDPGLMLACSQDAWPQTGSKLLPEYLELLHKEHGLEPRALDFAADVEAARKAINAHVAEVTRDRIPELLHQGDITSTTRMVLTNAIYLKADWLLPFPIAQTKDAPFRLAPGTSVEVPTMHVTGPFEWVDTGAMVVIRLPYQGRDFALDLALPIADATPDDSLAALLAPAAEADWRGKLARTAIALSLPRFRIENRMVLNDALRAIGIVRAFGADADFSGIDGNPHFLRIDAVIQQTFFDVAEKGTEAAAATAVAMRGGRPREPRAVAFDRPFAYALRDLETGMVLFAGRCVDPRGGSGK